MVHLDGVAVEQVLVNLIDNAIEYTPAEAPIEIRAEVSGPAVVVRVLDSGPGLPAGMERRVFEKFFRAERGRARGRRGIGLGLAICHGIVEAHGGTITASNRPGGSDGAAGAEFRFTLPLAGQAPRVDSTG
jgi:two-component system sensor histidine kinase KdpD